ncbi:hypothetical protein Bca101_035369 [Brassica carinata]
MANVLDNDIPEMNIKGGGGALQTSMSCPQSVALIIHYVSYVDKLIINLAVDTAVIPDPHLLCDDLVESLNIIKLAALEKGLHKMEV